jgi:hypothetical protein
MLPRIVTVVYGAQSLVFSQGCYCGICYSVFSFLPGLLLWYMLLSTRRRQTIQRNWQHWVHKTQDEGRQIKNTTQHALDTTMCKQTEIT